MIVTGGRARVASTLSSLLAGYKRAPPLDNSLSPTLVLCGFWSVFCFPRSTDQHGTTRTPTGAVGMQNGTAVLENSLAVSCKITLCLLGNSIIPLSVVCPGDMKPHYDLSPEAACLQILYTHREPAETHQQVNEWVNSGTSIQWTPIKQWKGMNW